MDRAMDGYSLQNCTMVELTQSRQPSAVMWAMAPSTAIRRQAFLCIASAETERSFYAGGINAARNRCVRRSPGSLPRRPGRCLIALRRRLNHVEKGFDFVSQRCLAEGVRARVAAGSRGVLPL